MFSRITLSKQAQFGIVKDIKGLDLPPDALTDGNNIVLRDGVVQKISGHQAAFGSLGCRPRWALPYIDPATNTYYWIYAGETDTGDGVIYTFDGTSHTDRTRSTGYYTSAITTPWTGGVLNGVPVVNTGHDVPQVWLHSSGILDATFTDMATWPSGYTAAVIRPFREFLVALDVTDSSNTRDPNYVMWSDASTPYGVPSWTPTVSNQAGDTDLAEGGEGLVDALPLRGAFYIYKDRSTWVMRYVGGASVFAFDRVFSEHGLLAPRCVKAYKDGRHVMATLGDIIIHDGTTAVSIAASRVRREIFDNIDPDYFSTSFMAVNYRESEFWFCYPTRGQSVPDRAAIWNANSNAWTFRDLQSFGHISYGVNDLAAAQDWSSATDAWNTTTDIWGSRSYNPVVNNMIGWKYANTTANSAAYQLDSTNTFDGTTFTAFAQRTGLSLAGANQQGQAVFDLGRRKSIRRAWLRLEGGPVIVRIGVADTPDGTYTWSSGQTFEGSGDYKVDFRANGRYFGYWIESVGDVSWKLYGITLEVREGGTR